MEFKFQKVRNFIAGLVGTPNLSEKMAIDLDNAVKADEASVEALLAATKVASATSPSTTSPTTLPPTPVAEVQALTVEPTLGEILATIKSLKTENARLASENHELSEFRAAQSPRNVALTTENLTGGVVQRVSKSAEKDAKHLDEVNRLAMLYPDLMKDLA